MRSIRFGIFLIFTIILGSFSYAKTYSFRALYNDLKYNSSYFNAEAVNVESLRFYMDKENDNYVQINSYLRKYTVDEMAADTLSQTAQDIKAIDALIAHVPQLPSDIILFRGMTLNWHKSNSPFELGEEYTDKAFASTSTSLEVAESFAIGSWYPSSANFKDESAVLTLYFQTSLASGVLIDQGEDEVLLGHGIRFRIMQKKLVNETPHYLVQICQKLVCDVKVDRTDVLEQWNK